jgi:hypothetical protein
MHSPALKPYSTQVNEIFNLPTITTITHNKRITHYVYQKYFRKLAEKFFELVNIMLALNLSAGFQQNCDKIFNN